MFKAPILIEKSHYFQTAGDSNVNKNNGDTSGIGCSAANNINRGSALSAIQRPIIPCMNDKLPISPDQAAHPNGNYGVSHMAHPQNQPNQVSVISTFL